MRFPEYDDLDATALAALVRAGEVSPAEVLEAAIERIEARNPALSAVVERLDARARGRVDELPDGPLRGVPFLLKDLKIQLAGTVTTNSTRLRTGAVAEASSVLAERYEAAGLQIVGKSNTPEFGIMGITEPAMRAPCRNPWNPAHTPGGSSGGSGSAVAARIVPAAHAGDGGGSIRIPASACGLVGLKPTRGRVTMAPFAGESWCGFVQEHVLTRSVRDSALLLDVADTPTPGEPYLAPPHAGRWVDEVGADPGRLRIAVHRGSLYADETHPECLAAVDGAVKALEELGHEVVEACPPFERAPMVRAYFTVVASNVAWACAETARAAGRRLSSGDFEPATWLLSLIGRATPAPELIAMQSLMHRTGRAVAGFFQQYDAFVCPTLAQPPVEVGALALSKGEALQVGLLKTLPFKALLDVALDKMGGDKLAYTPNTQLFNQTGQPAISLPLHQSADGLPIGVQIAAPLGGEGRLLRLARQLEVARPWADRRPPLLANG